jgi:hypothetical protein
MIDIILIVAFALVIFLLPDKYITLPDCETISTKTAHVYVILQKGFHTIIMYIDRILIHSINVEGILYIITLFAIISYLYETHNINKIYHMILYLINLFITLISFIYNYWKILSVFTTFINITYNNLDFIKSRIISAKIFYRVIVICISIFIIILLNWSV